MDASQGNIQGESGKEPKDHRGLKKCAPSGMSKRVPIEWCHRVIVCALARAASLTLVPLSHHPILCFAFDTKETQFKRSSTSLSAPLIIVASFLSVQFLTTSDIEYDSNCPSCKSRSGYPIASCSEHLKLAACSMVNMTLCHASRWPSCIILAQHVCLINAS